MSAKPLIKFCGLTSTNDIAAAVDAGADALGFVLCESPRRVSPEGLAALLEGIPTGILRVAVMACPHPELIALSNELPFDAVQCEPAAAPLPRLRGQRFLLPAFRDGADAAQGIADYRALNHHRRTSSAFEGAVLLDGSAGGGRGIQPDLERARLLASTGPLILAGGLTPENVARLANKVRPLAVDVSSGIESAPGRKDPARMDRFARSLACLGQASRDQPALPQAPTEVTQ